ncbi:MAG: hypothetical protein GWN39_03870, partial [Thermoplasmata archaeon]|nr:hypothetical protein [Thermoplasmata archaeon]NIS11182.1 hypothetical protein [Thermoplasmata archaeon]NIV77901.1 hypothetical protein [Thermoplasmata archaeon]NIW87933.1 hypothetical protein [Thermoplasmata archaeon]
MFVAVSLVLLPSTADAEVTSPPDERGIYIYSESLDYTTIFPGDQGIDFYIRIRNDDDDPFADD